MVVPATGDTMIASRRRRIVQWAVIVVVAPVLLFAWYFSAWVVVSRAGKARLVSTGNVKNVRLFFTPLINYADSDLPGGYRLWQLWWAMNPVGVKQHRGKTILDIPPLSPVARPIPATSLPPGTILG